MSWVALQSEIIPVIYFERFLVEVASIYNPQTETPIGIRELLT